MEGKFEEKCLHKLQNLDLSKHGIEKEKIKQYGFFTKNGGDITYNLLKEAEKIILVDVPTKVYSDLRLIFVFLFERSGFKDVKINEIVDFEKLYKLRKV